LMLILVVTSRNDSDHDAGICSAARRLCQCRDT
jgi:hypothetical protein